MRMVSIALALVTLASASAALAQGPLAQAPAPEQTKFWTPAEGTWQPFPDIFPEGGAMKVISGDPATGPADFYFKFPAQYGVPLHFHTPVERVYVDRGTMEFEARGGKRATLDAGGYFLAPSRMPHTATCTSTEDCYFFLSSSGPFDIHLVNEAGQVTRSWRCCG